MRVTQSRRHAVCLALVALASCVVRLNDKNSPAPNGNVTGPAVDCSAASPLPGGAPAGAAEIKYVGRYDKTDPARVTFDWSGNYIEARFEGSQIVAGFESRDEEDKPNAGTDIRFTAVIDGGAPSVFYVTTETRYTIATGLGPGPHQVVIHRDTEADNGGRVIFTGFDFGQGATILPPVRRPRRIEMIGDSISCGYGNEGDHATCPFAVTVRDGVQVPTTENQYLAYGSIVGRALDADVVTTCWSGKGVLRNYKDRPRVVDPNTFVTIPGFWKRTIAKRRKEEPEKLWDFAAETPDEKPQVVVINLGTNDFTRDQSPDPYLPDYACVYDPTPCPTGPDAPDTKTVAAGDTLPDRDLNLDQFFEAYLAFVVEVRSKRPDAHVFLQTPPMLTDQFPDEDARTEHRQVLQRVVDARAAAGDAKVYAMELVEQGTRYGLGCDYHPNLEVHRIMADQLLGAIRSKTCW